jgi:hypothetical protein
MTEIKNVFLFRQTVSFGEKSGKTMLGKCGCRAAGFSLSTGLEQPGRDKNRSELHIKQEPLSS